MSKILILSVTLTSEVRVDPSSIPTGETERAMAIDRLCAQVKQDLEQKLQTVVVTARSEDE